MAIGVAVLGAGGRMGRTVCRAVADDPDLALVGAVDPALAGQNVETALGVAPATTGTTCVGRPEDLSDAVQVVVDFTHLDAARANLQWAAGAGVHAVVGTSGFTDSDYAALQQAFTASNCLIAPNFAIGAVLMMRFAELAAPWFSTAEVIELHHDGKRDAPSGTAVRTVERMAAASGEWNEDPTRTETLPGARGAAGPGGIRVHAVRLQGMVAHQEVLLGTVGETLSIRHDSYDRASFMPGVVLAAKQVADHPGLTVGLDTYLGL
jgi:4-hydroxy-tetrahydrodipicolinate reductase